MAIVKKKRISWTPALDADIVSHRVFVEPEGNTIDPTGTNYVEVGIGEAQEVILPDAFPSGTFIGDGNYIVGIVAVDDVGNLSDVSVVTSPFDFIAPSAPTDIVVENV